MTLTADTIVIPILQLGKLILREVTPGIVVWWVGEAGFERRLSDSRAHLLSYWNLLNLRVSIPQLGNMGGSRKAITIIMF